MDPLFKVEATAIYNEFLPDRPSKNIAQVESADTKLDSLALDAKRAQYESDQLSLARDIAQIGNLIRALSKSDHARRTERILHIRNQNVIGASLVSTWMASSCSVMSGSVKDQAAAIERARSFQMKIHFGWYWILILDRPRVSNVTRRNHLKRTHIFPNS